ncbi:MAG: hypothetical protein ING65_16625 [Rhodocyclaceae bacterium]|nr:hypothetical protein [Rhodocyclaceae bacterium]
MMSSNTNNAIRRIKVSFTENEITILKKESAKTNKSISEFIAETILASLGNKPVKEEKRAEPTVDVLLERFSKLERLQRSILMNTSVARSHATAVMEVGEKNLVSALKSHLLDATEKQRAIYFDLYPEQKEGAK